MSYPFRKAVVAAVTAVTVATASTLAPVQAFADSDSTASPLPTADTTGQVEYDNLIAAVKKEAGDGSKSIGSIRAKAEQQKDDWGYDAAFEALNRLDEAQIAVDNIDRILKNLPDEPNEDALKDLKQARVMSFTVNQKISDAKYDVDLAERINKGEVEIPFECKDAIDVGDTSGSSTGSSTTGIFNPLGNRVVYSKTGEPNCTTNLEYFATKFTSTFTTLVSIASFFAAFSKLFIAVTQIAQQPRAAAPAPAPTAG